MPSEKTITDENLLAYGDTKAVAYSRNLGAGRQLVMPQAIINRWNCSDATIAIADMGHFALATPTETPPTTGMKLYKVNKKGRFVLPGILQTRWYPSDAKRTVELVDLRETMAIMPGGSIMQCIAKLLPTLGEEASETLAEEAFKRDDSVLRKLMISDLIRQTLKP